MMYLATAFKEPSLSSFFTSGNLLPSYLNVSFPEVHWSEEGDKAAVSIPQMPSLPFVNDPERSQSF